MRTHTISSSSGSVPSEHRSVLLHESVDLLALLPGDCVIDATLGGGGHARAFLEKLGEEGFLIGFDADGEAVARAEAAMPPLCAKHSFIEANFRTMAEIVAARSLPRPTKIFFDLGWSSHTLETGRGFSFLKEEPLLMTYAKEEDAVTADDIINTWSEKTLADIFYGYADETRARKIAHAIVERREKKKFETARELGDFLARILPRGKTHSATRVFQALRIAVNDEIGALEEGLASAWKLIPSGGRICVISFHSLEDRVIKLFFASRVKEGAARLLSKKPIVPSREESLLNPRARSAKLRGIEKI